MSNDEFDQVPQILFNGVSSLYKQGCPGTLIPLTHDTRAVLCADNPNNVIIAATRFGLGRCLVFAHHDYLKMFKHIQEKERRFVENCRQWLARGYSGEFLCIDEINSMIGLESYGKILVWDGHCSKDEAFMNDLCKYLQQGGALICGTCAWGWLQCNNGKNLSQFPFTHFCDYIGIKITGNYTDCSDPIPFRPELVAFKNVYHVVRNLANNPRNKQYLAIIGPAIKEMGDTLPGVPLETLQNIVMNVFILFKNVAASGNRFF
ncbi:unnamed protein product [Rotaria sordida]|uniref:Uncharacterized protein n=2 Tax=Rotaria sordida TaxID=392033 RepID=A0A815RYS8_9BILA|nr:unnamed protein product [Rotaria sordida]CAF4167846.1 unnamed protein product [Rotaria sordida]